MRAPAMLRWAAAGLALVALLAAAPPAAAFYLPGVAPTDFAKVRTHFLPPWCHPPEPLRPRRPRE